MSLTLVKETTWDDMFVAWRDREADWGWPEIAAERGFDSWDAWRLRYCKPLGLPDRPWTLYRVDDPLIFVPKMWVGAFRGWRKYFSEGDTRLQFGELVQSPTLRENDKIVPMIANFPSPTTIIGLRLHEDVICVEGTHRCAALALMAADGKPVEAELTIAITDFSEDEQTLFDQVRTQGSAPWKSA